MTFHFNDDMRDKIAEIVRMNDGNLPLEDHYTATADAILAALPDMIQPLVWDGFHSGPYKIEVQRERPIAELLFCGRAIKEDEEHERLRGGYLTLVSIDDLKAAANAHHAAQGMLLFGVVS
jgi:hypothetical protein